MNKKQVLYKDFVILGAGFVGLLMASFLKKNNCNFVVLEYGQKQQLLVDDQKSFALSKLTIELLVQLQIWDKISSQVGIINDIFVYEENRGEYCCHFTDKKNKFVNGGNERFSENDLRFDNIQDSDDLPMGCIVDSILLKKQLLDLLGLENIITNFSYSEIKVLGNGDNLIYDQQHNLAYVAKNIIVCEGRNSLLPEYFSLRKLKYDYQQSAFLFKIEHDYAHNNIAIEQFFNDGMIACLPLNQANQSAIVWINLTEYANLLGKLSMESLAGVFCKRFSGKLLGKAKIISSIKKYPLSLQVLLKNTYKNIFFIGDCAHAIHPVAGQGFNLGVRDVLRLLQYFELKIYFNNSFAENIFHNIDVDYLLWLSQKQFVKKFLYQMNSLSANYSMIGFTHGLNKIFLNQNYALHLIRNKVTSLISNCSILHNFLQKNAMGKK